MGLSLPLPRETMTELYAHAEKTYPNECCGILLGDKHGRQCTKMRPCTNVYDEYHAREPERYPRTSKTAYLIDPRELLALQKEMRASGDEMKVIYHSHVDVDAYFSEEDKRISTSGDQPVFPDVAYLVISCRKGHADGGALFVWDEQRKDFSETWSEKRPP